MDDVVAARMPRSRLAYPQSSSFASEQVNGTRIATNGSTRGPLWYASSSKSWFVWAINELTPRTSSRCGVAPW